VKEDRSFAETNGLVAGLAGWHIATIDRGAEVMRTPVAHLSGQRPGGLVQYKF
jgi:hypothetical protein